jgi:hypothetical protein
MAKTLGRKRRVKKTRKNLINRNTKRKNLRVKKTRKNLRGRKLRAHRNKTRKNKRKKIQRKTHGGAEEEENTSLLSKDELRSDDAPFRSANIFTHLKNETRRTIKNLRGRKFKILHNKPTSSNSQPSSQADIEELKCKVTCGEGNKQINTNFTVNVPSQILNNSERDILSDDNNYGNNNDNDTENAVGMKRKKPTTSNKPALASSGASSLLGDIPTSDWSTQHDDPDSKELHSNQRKDKNVPDTHRRRVRSLTMSDHPSRAFVGGQKLAGRRPRVSATKSGSIG